MIIWTRIWFAVRSLAERGRDAVGLSLRFFSRPPAVEENCHARIVLGMDAMFNACGSRAQSKGWVGREGLCSRFNGSFINNTKPQIVWEPVYLYTWLVDQ